MKYKFKCTECKNQIEGKLKDNGDNNWHQSANVQCKKCGWTHCVGVRKEVNLKKIEEDLVNGAADIFIRGVEQNLINKVK